MKKETIRDVMISCASFLFLVFLASLWAHTNLPINEEDTISVAKTVEKKTIYLTFDDGPSKHTKEILDILDTYSVKATFFVTGENPDYYDLIKEASSRGHVIGMHTFSHNYAKIYASETAYFEDLDKINALIEQQIGRKVTLLRFPGGTSNTVSRKYQGGIMSALSKDVLEKGYQYFDWNASNGDGNSYVGSSSLVNQALREVKDKHDVMMLMHDGTGNKATVEALPSILENLQKQGYEFKVIDEFTPVFHHTIAN